MKLFLKKILYKINLKCRRLFFANTVHAPELTKKAIVGIVSQTHVPVILEIGAADGLDTLELLQAFGDRPVRIFCFEPDPRNIASFKENVKDSRVTLIECAIGAEDGAMTFHQSSTIYSSSLKAPHIQNLQSVWPEMTFENSFDVTVVTIDSFAKKYNLGTIDFIWADVQGAEDLMLLGAKNTLAKTRYIYTEYNKAKDFYQDSPTLEQIKNLTGPHWHVIRNYGADVLLKNDTIVA